MSVRDIERALALLGADDLQRISQLALARLAHLARAGETSAEGDLGGSALDLVRDLPSAGDGLAAPDLSTSKAHMEGFGERAA
ncbi:hypothetical protein [Rubrivirga sp.]|uniref:hypothetical protein n=1 Tax=Rubrivirga sp. TaxID=1885344 RepID=UPI003B52F81D